MFEARTLANRALRAAFEGVAPGEVALACDAKPLVRTHDGLLVLTSYAARDGAATGRS